MLSYLKYKNTGPSESGSLKKGAKKCDFRGCDKDATRFGKHKGVKRFLCTKHFKQVYNCPDW